MSRIGKKPVPVPSGVSVSVANGKVSVSGSKGSLEWTHRPEVGVALDDDKKNVVVSIDARHESNKEVRALWGTTRALISNMIVGVTEGYSKTLEVVGVGWTAELAGQKLRLGLGLANKIEVPVPQGLTVTVEKQNVKIEGTDKQAVGNFASSIRALRKPEPYNGKGVKYAGEVIRRKEGKAFGS